MLCSTQTLSATSYTKNLKARIVQCIYSTLYNNSFLLPSPNHLAICIEFNTR